MQATSILVMPSTVNSVEPAGEILPGSPGIRVNSTLQTKTRDSLFTSILQQGITLNASTATVPADALTAADADGSDKKNEKDPLDVCGLLMQLMVMNAPAQPATGTDGGAKGDTVNQAAVTDVAAVLSGLGTAQDGTTRVSDPSVAGLLQGNAAAAAVTLGGSVSSGNAAGTGGQQSTAAGGNPQNDSVLATLAAAVENALTQDAAGTEAQGTDAQKQAMQTSDDAQGQNVPGAQNAAATSGNIVFPARGGTDATMKSPGQASAQVKNADTADQTSVTGPGGVSGTPAGLKAAGSGEKSESGLGRSTHERDKAEDGPLPGTPTEQIIGGTTFKGETTVEKSTAVEKALSKFAEDLRSVQGGTQELQIVLEPESLGMLTISVTKTETGISAKIKSEDKEIVAAISDHLHKLISAMESKGIHLDDVNVVYSQTEQNTGFGQQSFSQGRDGAPNNRYGSAFAKNQDGDTSDTDFWQGFYGDETTGDTAVDYRV